MKKYLNAENLTVFVIVVLGVWVGSYFYSAVAEKLDKLKASVTGA